MRSVAGNLYTGTLDRLILQTLKWGPRHGYAIARWISDRTEEHVDAVASVLHLSGGEISS